MIQVIARITGILAAAAAVLFLVYQIFSLTYNSVGGGTAKPLPPEISWQILSDYHTYVAHPEPGTTCYRYNSDSISCIKDNQP